MGRPSVLRASAEHNGSGEVGVVKVAGSVVAVSSGSFRADQLRMSADFAVRGRFVLFAHFLM